MRLTSLAGGVLFLCAFLSGCGVPTQKTPTGRLLYTTTQDEIYLLLNLNSGAQIRLTDDDYFDRDAQFSPDGEQIAYASKRGEHWQIFVMKADGSNPKQLTFADEGADLPAWSPDGQWIAFNLGWDIYLMRPDGSGLRELIAYEGLDMPAVWSPDGRKIAFGSELGAEMGYDMDIYVFDLETRSLERLTYHPALDGPRAWSPDGQFLLFRSDRGQEQFKMRTFVMELESKEYWRLIEDGSIPPWEFEQGAEWSPDGEWLVVDLADQICVVDLKGVLHDCYAEEFSGNLTDWRP